MTASALRKAVLTVGMSVGSLIACSGADLPSDPSLADAGVVTGVNEDGSGQTIDAGDVANDAAGARPRDAGRDSRASIDGAADANSNADGATCTPDCSGKSCGPDGCGGQCGTCPVGKPCTVAYKCMCTPQCSGRQCGDDGCGGTCGTCATGTCNASGLCQTGSCTPNCTNKTCGDDGCGGSCGTCSEGTCNSFGFCGGAQCGAATCGSHAACCRCGGQVLGCFGLVPPGKCSDYGANCSGG